MSEYDKKYKSKLLTVMLIPHHCSLVCHADDPIVFYRFRYFSSNDHAPRALALPNLEREEIKMKSKLVEVN